MKDLLKGPLVDKFWRTENQLLQVLLQEFTLRRKGAGACLEVTFDENTPAVWLREGKAAVREWMEHKPGHSKKAKLYQSKINEFLDAPNADGLVLNDPAFPFRYANGGTLPVICMGGVEYYALFYRDVFPIGWNISNGASDTREELMLPAEVIERELREELMVVTAKHKKRYVFLNDQKEKLERSEYAMARRLWGERFAKAGYKDYERWKELPLPLKWLQGPDQVQVNFADEKTETTTDCFVTITTEDFGIEVDRIAKMTIDEDSILLDGEIYSGRLLNRPVALFEVGKMNAAVANGESSFLPDRFFYGVPPQKRKHCYYLPDEWDSKAMKDLILDIESFRTKKQIDEFKECSLRYDLCPITKRIIQRLNMQIEKERHPYAPSTITADKYDFFISYSRGDEHLAMAVYRHVRERLHRRVFCNLEGKHHSHFRREIEEALETSKGLISIGSSIDQLTNPWPAYECEVFHNDILIKKKPKDTPIISFVPEGIDIRLLPLPQRIFHAIQYKPNDLKPAFKELGRYL